MRNDRFRLTARHLWLGSAFAALGLASATAHAQTEAPQHAGPPGPADSAVVAAAPSTPNPVEGVDVTGRRPEVRALIPDDKRAEFDDEVAREAAFRAYRQSTPPLTSDDKGVGDPNDQSKDFPGLQSYLPK